MDNQRYCYCFCVVEAPKRLQSPSNAQAYTWAFREPIFSIAKKYILKALTSLRLKKALDRKRSKGCSRVPDEVSTPRKGLKLYCAYKCQPFPPLERLPSLHRRQPALVSAGAAQSGASGMPTPVQLPQCCRSRQGFKPHVPHPDPFAPIPHGSSPPQRKASSSQALEGEPGMNAPHTHYRPT